MARFRSCLAAALRIWPGPSDPDDIEERHRARAQEIVAELVRLAQRRTELALGLVRIIFCLSVLLHFMLTNRVSDPGALGRAAFEIPAVIGAAMSSLPLMIRAARGDLPAWSLDASVIVDILGAHLTLLGGVLYPWPTYRGLLHLPDVGVVPVLCLAAGLRMSTRTTLVATMVNGASLAALIAVDLTQNARSTGYGSGEIYLYAVYLLAAGALGLLLVTRSRSLASAAARHALRAEAVRDGLTHVLQDRHDVASLLSSARINADLLTRELQRHEGERQLLSAIERSLGDLSRIVEDSRDRAYTELVSSARVELVDAELVSDVLLESLRSRYTDVRFERHGVCARRTPVQMAGGSRGLERVLLNLLVNAVEGRGDSQATMVSLEIIGRGRHTEIVVSDDGPGFRADQLERRSERLGSTKLRGSGLGLLLVERIVAASRGSLQLENAGSGARVRIVLWTDAPSD